MDYWYNIAALRGENKTRKEISLTNSTQKCGECQLSPQRVSFIKSVIYYLRSCKKIRNN